jgi:hypothetical protein
MGLENEVHLMLEESIIKVQEARLQEVVLIVFNVFSLTFY